MKLEWYKCFIPKYFSKCIAAIDELVCLQFRLLKRIYPQFSKGDTDKFMSIHQALEFYIDTTPISSDYVFFNRYDILLHRLEDAHALINTMKFLRARWVVCDTRTMVSNLEFSVQ